MVDEFSATGCGAEAATIGKSEASLLKLVISWEFPLQAFAMKMDCIGGGAFAPEVTNPVGGELGWGLEKRDLFTLSAFGPKKRARSGGYGNWSLLNLTPKVREGSAK